MFIKTTIKMESIPVFPDILKTAENADVSRTQGVCHVIYVLYMY